MLHTKSWGLAGTAILMVAMLGYSGLDAWAADGCTATDEEELYAALADSACGGVITLNKSPIQDKGIQLTKDFDGAGAVLVVGTGSYGLLIDDIGLDGHVGVPVGTSITIRNVTIRAAETTKALINISDVPVTLENVTTDRTATDGLATPNYYAHIDVKNTRGLALTDYAALGGIIAIDYSQEVANNLKFTLDAASAVSLSDVPVFVSAYGDGVITPGDSETLAFLTDDATIIAKDGVELDAEGKQSLIATAPFILTGSTEDGRSVVVVEDGVEDAVVTEIAANNDDFASFISQVGDDAVFLALSDRGDCDGSGCQAMVTVSNLEAHTTYYLYHYDGDGVVELVGQFSADANGDASVGLEKFSGYVLSQAKVELASVGGGAAILTPQTGVAGVREAANAKTSSGLMIIFGLSVSALMVYVLGRVYGRGR